MKPQAGAKFGFNMITAEPYVEPSAAEWAAEEDSWVEESLSDGSAAPARGWLEDANHASFEGHPPTMNELIESLHTAGAEQVWMVDIVEFQGRQLCDTIAVELPAAGVQRESLFAAVGEFWGGEPPEDVGQRYLTMSFD